MPIFRRRDLIIYADESTEKGRYYSHFYGGTCVKASDREAIEALLKGVKDRNNLFSELKWTKITEKYKEKYLAFVSAYFDLIDEGLLKTRVMFTQNSNRPIGLEEHQVNNEYFLLYYQLIKHAFGLMYCAESGCTTMVSLFLDDIPKNAASFEQFKGYVQSLGTSPKFISQRVTIPKAQITSVDSKDHLILQGLDIILGAMQFRLNDKHLEKPEGKHRRAKRTLAKEEVYKYINQRIRRLYPGFNIGVSTAIKEDTSNRWKHPYRHWLFIPSEHEALTGTGKQRNRKGPTKD